MEKCKFLFKVTVYDEDTKETYEYGAVMASSYVEAMAEVEGYYGDDLLNVILTDTGSGIIKLSLNEYKHHYEAKDSF